MCSLVPPWSGTLFLFSLGMCVAGLYLIFKFRNFKLRAIEEKKQYLIYIEKVRNSEVEFFSKLKEVVPLEFIKLKEHSVSVTLPSHSGMKVSRSYSFKEFNPLSQ